MASYTFYHKNSSAVITLTAKDFEEAQEELTYLVANPYPWRSDRDEDDEEE